MNIDWQHFTPMTSLTGGMMIGLAAAAVVLLNGRIAGISGIVGGLLRPQGTDARWRIAFVAGLLFAPVLFALLHGLPRTQVDATLPVLACAGLLVGVGTRVGSGCTSGHGVCGLSRLSPRSMVATGVFMVAAMVTVFVVHHVLGAGGA